MTYRTGLWSSTPEARTLTPNKALVRVRKDIKERPDLAPIKHVDRMLEFLWRESSAYRYTVYGYDETHHAARVLYRVWVQMWQREREHEAAA